MSELQSSIADRLPLKLRQRILSASTDVLSLRSIALSSPAFFHAFVSAETHIATTVLLRQIGHSVLPEAILALQSARLAAHDLDSLADFATNHLSSIGPPPASWTLSAALPLGRFHDLVSYFANTFAYKLLNGPPFDQTDRNAPAPTRSEVHRFERALYRFQIFCNLFTEQANIPVGTRMRHEEKPADHWQLFFSYFAPYENEQLACVNDFLMRMVASAYNDLVDHDVSWGGLMVNYIDTTNAAEGQYLLRQGLESLYHLAKAEKYDARRKLLHRGDDIGDEPLETVNFLASALSASANADYEGADMLSELSAGEKALHIRPPFFPDPDPGPPTVWEWAHRTQMPDDVVNVPRNDHFRRWGYVFWDQSRLEALGVYSDTWNASKVAPKDELGELQGEDRQRLLKESWGLRRELWSAGGTGWWNRKDERKRSSQSLQYIPIDSLSDAKAFLRSLKLY